TLHQSEPAAPGIIPRKKSGMFLAEIYYKQIPSQEMTAQCITSLFIRNRKQIMMHYSFRKIVSII
ncbi:TPA: hypothetical protein ACHJ2P_004304, partial [Escherichia coli]